jgi:acetoin utilization protein AcuB
MNITEIMSKNVVTVEMDDPLSIVKEIFDNAKFHHVLIKEDGKLFGVLSDRDLLKALSGNLGTSRYTMRDMETLDKRVHSIMTRNPIKLYTTSTVKEAMDIFNKSSFSCLPIVDTEDIIHGIVTTHDIIKNFNKIASSEYKNQGNS